MARSAWHSRLPDRALVVESDSDFTHMPQWAVPGRSAGTGALGKVDNMFLSNNLHAW